MAASGIGRRRALAQKEGNPAYVEKREQMVKAAAVLFKEKGFEATTLADIAQVVGIDRASIYYYVESKDELMRELVSNVSAANLEVAKALRTSHLDAPSRIRVFIESTMRTYDENYPQVFVFIQEDMSKIAPGDTAWAREMRRQVREFESTVDELLNEGVADGTFRDDLDSRIVAKSLWGMLNWTHRWYKPEARSAEEIARTFTELFLSGILAGASSKPRRPSAGNRVAKRAPAKKAAATKAAAKKASEKRAATKT